MSKHTPGPWKAGSRSVTAPETEDRLGLDVRLYGGNSGDHRANARLIAAAPDLLAALVNLLGVIDGEGGTKPNAREMARDALTLAVGTAWGKHGN